MAENKTDKKENTNNKKVATNSKNTKTNPTKKVQGNNRPNNNSKGKNNVKQTTQNKGKAPSKKQNTSTKKKTTQTPKTQTKKVVKKVEPKEVEKKKEIPKLKPVTETKSKLNEQDLLEKTLIFDGRQNQNLAEVVEKLEEKNVVLEDKVIKRKSLNKIIIIILTILIIAILITTTIFVVKGELEKTPKNVQTLNTNIYSKVVSNFETIGTINGSKEDNKDEDNKKDDVVSIQDIKYDNIETISLADFEQKVLAKENMTILISSTTCYACISFEPTISEVYKSLERTIYRLNVTAMSKEEVTRFRTYYEFTATPTIFNIKDGYVSAEKTGQMLKDELTTWVQENTI